MIEEIQEKFQLTRREMNAKLIDRQDEVDVALTAMLAGESALYVGTPGTAKSALADAIVSWVHGNKFSMLLTKYSKPEEIFGPINVMKMKEGKYERVTDGMLPEADIAFLDELFKGSSAILNTTLKILNERTFKNGLEVMHCPLKLCIAASNEWPVEAKELGALFDRFLFRKKVNQVTGEDAVARLMFEEDLTPQLSTKLALAELSQAKAACNDVAISDDTKEILRQIRGRIFSEGIIIGDRRLRKSTQAMKCAAWLNGETEVTTDAIAVLTHIWWSDPIGHPHTVLDIIADVAKPPALQASSLLAQANELVNGTNPKDAAKAASSCGKLGDIIKQLKKLSGERAKAAHDRVTNLNKGLRLALMESVS